MRLLLSLDGLDYNLKLFALTFFRSKVLLDIFRLGT